MTTQITSPEEKLSARLFVLIGLGTIAFFAAMALLLTFQTV